MNGCSLPSLRDLRWRSPLVGLSVREQGIGIDERYFACCAGKGMRLHKNAEVSMCGLQKRLDNLRTVLDTFVERWGHEHWHFLRGGLQTIDIDKLAAFRAGHEESGRVLITEGRSSPSYLWLVAIAAVWRFSCHVHFVSLRMGSDDGGIFPQHRRAKTIVLVENFFSPWHPENATDCESIINYCYNTRTPLWFDFVREHNLQKDNDKPKNARVVQLRTKINALRAKDPRQYLSGSGQAKLREMFSIR